MSTRDSDPHPVVLFDGVCNLCNASVVFVIDRDPRARFRFASLQSDFGEAVLRRFEVEDRLGSILLLDGDVLHRESTAALRIARGLSWPWSMLFAFIVIPPPLRNLVYRFIAKRRYRWFGQSEVCRVPTPDERARFVS